MLVPLKIRTEELDVLGQFMNLYNMDIEEEVLEEIYVAHGIPPTYTAQLLLLSLIESQAAEFLQSFAGPSAYFDRTCSSEHALP